MVFVECSPRLFTEFCLAFVKYSHSLSPISNYQKLPKIDKTSTKEIPESNFKKEKPQTAGLEVG